MGQQTQPAAPPQEAVLRVESLPTASDGSAVDPNNVSFTPAYSINKQAGIVSVYANERLHRQIAEYLQDLRRSSTSQVLIEAKVLEVQLTDEFITGIDWGSVTGGSFGDLDVSLNLGTPDMNPTNGTNLFTLGMGGNDFTGFVNMLSRFGTVRALASPRLTVINNQPAVLSVAKNTVYFELDVTRTTTGSPPVTDTTVDSEIKTVPEGVLINVLPSIDLDRGQISMQVRPTVTRIDSFKNDPGVSILAAGIESPIPELNVQEIDSVVKLKSGQVMVMGGLIVSDDDHEVGTTDRELYRTFGNDRRPFKM
jgi:general secretion pathway protein D